MNDPKQSSNETTQDGSFLISSLSQFNRIENKLDAVLTHLEDKSIDNKIFSGKTSEKDAIARFKKSQTWFWERRKKGELPFTRVGKTIYYSEEDLSKLFKGE